MALFSIPRIVEDPPQRSKGWPRSNCQEVSGGCARRLGQPGHHVAVRCSSGKGERAEEEVEFELPKVLIKVLFWALLKVLLLGKVLFKVLKKVLKKV